MTTHDFVPDTENADGVSDAPPPDGPPDGASDAPAPNVPAKFLDPETGVVRVDALAQSYRALERRLGQGGDTDPEADAEDPDDVADGADLDAGADLDDDGLADLDGDAAPDDLYPDAPDGYRIAAPHPWLDGDQEVNELLHAAGFTQGQAQLVYDLAAEKVVPLIEGLVSQTGVQQQQARLAKHFGDGQDFEKTAAEVAAWGRTNLPAGLFRTLSDSPDGVIAMRHLMRSGEPAFLEAGAGANATDEAELHALMDDPKYWRDHDPDTVRRVQDGFRRLYPD